VKTDKTYYLLNRQRKHRVDSRGIRRFLTGLITEVGRPEAFFSVVFVTDKVMHSYNLRYRHIDKPTDVLSFPGHDGYLGDILISTETAWKQARKSATLSFDDNIRRLLLHGILHLSGYDHETDNGEMRAIERQLRRKFQC
jgi:probable rRNA maturation factor